MFDNVLARKSRASTSLVASALVLAIACALVLFGPAGRAAAADFGSTPITSVTVTPTIIADAGTARVDFTWVAPASAAPNDTYTISLPDQLEPASTRNIELVDADTGEVAVLGVWTGKTATFTFQSYIATHTGVRGSGYFYVKWDHSVVGEEGGTFDGLEIGGQTIPTITKGAGAPVATTRNADKGGGWDDETQTQFTWFLSLPGSTVSAIVGEVSVEDAAPSDPGYTYDCAAAQLRRDLGGFPSPTNETTYTAPGAAPDATGFTCSDSALTLTLDGIPAGTFYTLIVPVTVTDDDRTSFSNTASFLWPALQDVPQEESAELIRDDAGGLVEADDEVPGTVCVGDYVWEDTNRNGVQDAGEPGIPGVVLALLKVAADGTVTMMMSGGTAMTTTTDGSGLYRFCELPVLEPGEKYRTAIDTSQPALQTYTVTVSGRGTSANDSSAAEGFVDTDADLTVAGASDYTLDYGFYVAPRLAESGADSATMPTAAAGALLLLLGAFALRHSRRAARSASRVE